MEEHQIGTGIFKPNVSRNDYYRSSTQGDKEECRVRPKGYSFHEKRRSTVCIRRGLPDLELLIRDSLPSRKGRAVNGHNTTK